MVDKSRGQLAPVRDAVATTNTTGSNVIPEETFFQKNKNILLIVAVALVGFFAYKKFNK